jgi:SulP family sulfate permease
MPTSVFEGFTVAVALIIGFKQMNSALGLHPHHKHGHFFPDVYESFAALDTAEWGPCVMFFLVVLLLFPLMKKFPSVPWMVLIPVVTILFGWLSSEGLLGAWDLPTLKTKYGALQPDIIIMLKPEPLSAAFANGDIFGLIIAAGSVAFVAILETLISAKIAGFRLDKDFDQAVETRGITAAHAVCGLLGAMPPTGVFVRTSINVSLGATHRISQFINAVIVLLITVVAMPLFSFLPLSCIAAVLVVSAGRMVPKAYLRMLWKEDRGSFWLCILTAFLCCAIDPVVGLLCGMLVAFMGNSRRNQNAPNMFVECSEAASGDCTITLNGPVTYVTAETMLTAFKKVAKRDDVQSIMVNLESVTTVDVDGLSSLEKMDKCLGQAKKRANFGPKQHAEALIGRSTFFQLLVEEGRITYQPLEMPGGGKTKEGVLAGAEEGARQ